MIFLMEEKFVSWLEKQLRERDWTAAQLSRRAKIKGNATVNRILSGARNPGVEVCLKIARALGEPEEKVLRLAGHLTIPVESRPDGDEKTMLRDLWQAWREDDLSVIPQSSIVLQSKTVEHILRLAPTPDDVDRIQELLDSYRRHQVYDFALWQLRQQIVAYNSSGEESIPDDWKEAIKIIDLLIATHKATPGARREMARLLEDAFESQQVDQADNETAGSLSLPPVTNS